VLTLPARHGQPADAIRPHVAECHGWADVALSGLVFGVFHPDDFASESAPMSSRYKLWVPAVSFLFPGAW
jgi:hypothetical protein